MQLATGTFHFDLAKDPSGWHLHQGTGDRSVRYEIKLPPFGQVPSVMCALTGFDTDQQHGSRVLISVDDVSPDEFTLVIFTWADTLLYGISGSWIAITQ